MLRAPLVALVIVASALTLEEGARADQYPGFSPYFELGFTHRDPQAPTGLTLTYGLEQGYQFSTVVFYIPRDWGVAQGESIPVGTVVGSVAATETFGFINGACNTLLPIEFELFNASLDPTNPVSFDDLEFEQRLDSSTEGYGTKDFAEDKDANGILDGIDHYPDFLSAMPTDGPLMRLAGIFPIAGVPVLFQVLIFAPSTRLDFPDAEATRLVAGTGQAGYPMLIVVQDFQNPDGVREPGPISDYCTPRRTAISLVAPDAGLPLLVNPQAGIYGATLVGLSKRDADNDGIANSVDTCPLLQNVGDPGIPLSGDVDGDGLDAACDPNDDPFTVGTTSDFDGDAYLNRQDNCPLAPNGQTMIMHDVFVDSPANQADQDFDDIGHVCDPNPESPDGESIVSVLTGEVIIGNGSGSGGPPDAVACPHCYRPGESLSETDEGGGNTLAVAAGLIGVGAGAVVVVVGGGTLYLLRRRRS